MSDPLSALILAKLNALGNSSGSSGTPINATIYSQATTYATDDYVVDNGQLWRAKSAAPAGTHGRTALNGVSKSVKSTGLPSAATATNTHTLITNAEDSFMAELAVGDTAVSIFQGWGPSNSLRYIRSGSSVQPNWNNLGHFTIDSLATAGSIASVYSRVLESNDWGTSFALISSDSGTAGAVTSIAASANYRLFRDVVVGTALDQGFETAAATTVDLGGGSAPTNPNYYLARRDIMFYTFRQSAGTGTGVTVPMQTSPFIKSQVANSYNSGTQLLSGVGAGKMLSYEIEKSLDEAISQPVFSKTATTAHFAHLVVVPIWHDGRSGNVLNPVYWEEVDWREFLPGEALTAQYRGSYQSTRSYVFRDLATYEKEVYEAVRDAAAGTHSVAGAPSPAVWRKEDFVTELIKKPVQKKLRITATQNWVCPAGVTEVSAILVGGGGASPIPASSSFGSAGGAGGEVIEAVVSVVPGTTYSAIVGAGGQAVNGTGPAGGSTSMFGLSAAGGVSTSTGYAASQNGNGGGAGVNTTSIRQLRQAGPGRFGFGGGGAGATTGQLYEGSAPGSGGGVVSAPGTPNSGGGGGGVAPQSTIGMNGGSGVIILEWTE